MLQIKTPLSRMVILFISIISKSKIRNVFKLVLFSTLGGCSAVASCLLTDAPNEPLQNNAIPQGCAVVSSSIDGPSLLECEGGRVGFSFGG